jgi:hypothetical protein
MAQNGEESRKILSLLIGVSPPYKPRFRSLFGAGQTVRISNVVPKPNCFLTLSTWQITTGLMIHQLGFSTYISCLSEKKRSFFFFFFLYIKSEKKIIYFIYI